MFRDNTGNPFQVGDWVEIRYARFRPGRIVEFRGALGPGGALVYRVRFGRKPAVNYGEFREDQLIHVTRKGDSAAKGQADPAGD